MPGDSDVIGGIDLGGTNVRVGIVDPTGAIHSFRAAPFDARRAPERAWIGSPTSCGRACARRATRR